MGGGFARCIPIFGLAVALSQGFFVQTASAGAALDIEATGGCVDASALRARLAPVLAPYATARGGTVAVVSQRTGEITSVIVRVVALSGDVVLDRRLTLRPEDCPSAPALVATILERFLRDFPRASWTDLPRQETSVIVVGHDLPWVVAVARLAALGRLPTPVGADADLGLEFEAGTARHRLLASANLRTGTPIKLGIGHVVDSTAALGVGWREIGDKWSAELEMRVGGRLTSGYGYVVNRNVWLPWLELAAAMTWPWQGWLVGPVVAVTPLQQHVTTAAGVRSPLPWLRLGIGGFWPLSVDLL